MNQAWSPNPRLNSRAGALTRKATFLTLGQEHSTNSTKQWSNCSNTLDQHTVTANTQTSWLKPQPPSPTHRFLLSLIWSPSAQKHIHRWLTLIKRTSMNPSTKSWVIKITNNQTCIRYTISLWSKTIKTTREGDTRRHLPGGQVWPRRNRLPDYPKEALLIK